MRAERKDQAHQINQLIAMVTVMDNNGTPNNPPPPPHKISAATKKSTEKRNLSACAVLAKKYGLPMPTIITYNWRKTLISVGKVGKVASKTMILDEVLVYM